MVARSTDACANKRLINRANPSLAHNRAALQIQDRLRRSRPVALCNQSQTQLTRLGLQRAPEVFISKQAIRQSNCLQMLPYQSYDVLISAWHQPDGCTRFRRCRLVAAIQVCISAVQLQRVVSCWQLFWRSTTSGIAIRQWRWWMLHGRAQSEFLCGRRWVDGGRRRPVDLTVRWRGQAGDAPFHRPSDRPVEATSSYCRVRDDQNTRQTINAVRFRYDAQLSPAVIFLHHHLTAKNSQPQQFVNIDQSVDSSCDW